MAVENDDKAAAHDDMELESDDLMTNVKPSAKEASDNSIDQRKMESGHVDEEEIDKLSSGATNALIKEEDDYYRDSSNITEGVLVKNSSTEDTELSVRQLRKKPDLVIVGPNHKFIVRSRYRSTSLGSCHDLCKYGHKHEPEKKIKRLPVRTIREGQPLMKTTSGDQEKGLGENVALKEELNRRLSLPSPIPGKAPLMRIEENNLPKKDVYRSKMKRVQSEIPSSGTASISKTDTGAVRKTVTQSSNLQRSSTQKVKEIKTWKEVDNFSKGEKEFKAKELISGSPETMLKKGAGHSKFKKNIKEKEPMINSLKTTLKKTPGLRARLFKDHKSSSRSKIQVNSEVAEIDGHDDIPEVTLCIIGPNAAGGNLQCSLRATRAGKPHELKGTRKGNGFSVLSSSSRKSSRPQGEDQQGSDATKNKQLDVKSEDGGSKTRTPRATSTVGRRINNSESKNTKHIETIRENGSLKTNTSRAKSTGDPKLRLIRKEKSHIEDKDASAWKLKFRRGTVVALQAANNAPKKLRFKRVKTLGEEQNVKALVRRNMKNECDMGNELHEPNLGPEKVRLRHQEASEKKDDVDLNNVIEETASKLVKTRKSKVKALVGAFETVMSLRDRKHVVEPSAS